MIQVNTVNTIFGIDNLITILKMNLKLALDDRKKII